MKSFEIFHHLFFEICSWRFVFRRFFQEIFHFHEDVFMEICHLKICSGDFFLFHEDVFMEICPLKIYSGDFYFWRFVQEIFPFGDLFRRFFLWRFVQEIFPFEDLFMEIVPFVRMCSRRFIHWRLKCRRFIPFWKFAHEDLSFENLNRRFLFMEICPLKIWIGDLSLEDLIMEICPLKICSGDFSFWNFVLEIYPFENLLGDLSFENWSTGDFSS